MEIPFVNLKLYANIELRYFFYTYDVFYTIFVLFDLTKTIELFNRIIFKRKNNLTHRIHKRIHLYLSYKSRENGVDVTPPSEVQVITE